VAANADIAAETKSTFEICGFNSPATRTVVPPITYGNLSKEKICKFKGILPLKKCLNSGTNCANNYEQDSCNYVGDNIPDNGYPIPDSRNTGEKKVAERTQQTNSRKQPQEILE
jgi:hypothetical protein